MSSSCVDNIGYKAAEYYKTIQIINGLQNQIQTLQQELFKLKGSVVEDIQGKLTELTEFKTNTTEQLDALDTFKTKVVEGLTKLSANPATQITGDIIGIEFEDLLTGL